MMPETGRIYVGDCLEIMRSWPDNFVDLVLCDPPYGLNYNNDGDLASRRESALGHKEKQGAVRPIINDDREDWVANMPLLLHEVGRILKTPGVCCCCGGGGGPQPIFAEMALEMDKKPLEFVQAVVWDKCQLGMGWHYRRSYEFMMVCRKGPRTPWHHEGKDQSNVVRIPAQPPQAGEHPCKKPVALMAKFIELHTRPGDIVVDPYCGHGPTLQAAEALGRRWIGIEINPEYAAEAERRVKSEMAQAKLF
jgi:DNA modification methylase